MIIITILNVITALMITIIVVIVILRYGLDHLSSYCYRHHHHHSRIAKLNCIGIIIIALPRLHICYFVQNCYVDEHRKLKTKKIEM